MNDRLHEFFDSKKDYDFSRQLKLHILYFALNCLHQEKVYQSRKLSNEAIRILQSDQLQKAFRDFRMPRVSWKLKIILELMKRKNAGLLSLL